jgi:hypothetical protein
VGLTFLVEEKRRKNDEAAMQPRIVLAAWINLIGQGIQEIVVVF